MTHLRGSPETVGTSAAEMAGAAPRISLTPVGVGLGFLRLKAPSFPAGFGRDGIWA